jgi:hypothetical protein
MPTPSLAARIAAAVDFYEIALDRGWAPDQIAPLADDVRRLLAERAEEEGRG